MFHCNLLIKVQIAFFVCANLAVKMLKVVPAGNSFFEQYYFLVIIFSVLYIYILELKKCKVNSILRTEERCERPPCICHGPCDKNWMLGAQRGAHVKTEIKRSQEWIDRINPPKFYRALELGIGFTTAHNRFRIWWVGYMCCLINEK